MTTAASTPPKAFDQLCKENGSRQEPTGADASEQNGMAESSWRVVSEMAMAISIDAAIDERF